MPMMGKSEFMNCHNTPAGSGMTLDWALPHCAGIALNIANIGNF